MASRIDAGTGVDEAIVEAVEAIARVVADHPDAIGAQPILDVVVASALRAVPGARSASTLLLDRRRHAVGVSASDPATAGLDQAQVTLGEGPAVEAATGSTITSENDLPHSTRWLRWAALAVGTGHLTVMSLPIRTRRVRGAVTLYGADSFAQQDVLAARLVAGAAALAVDNALSVTGLTRALETRDVIGQAKGILKERFSVDDRAAFALLVESSQDTNIKLREVASLLADGSLGLPPRS
ncbi:ANTAR domain-containing protein [Actinomycetospora chibensis]|uniref:ANTAR domain-containing protein n=1 Tax=Actinomycetospora chibensis TaxID=663606 RepID=A0ABV9RPS9_9PSEU|nr:ANTAR domain-containing protein [Actinomycetospora chibensis]MDD7923218.1 ANTAR domain-containing protein [Actinomycetospora chibensis]